jgi:hypothetical protein
LRGLLWAIVLLTVAATNEELLFRGYPFQRLVESWGAPIAVVAISGLFGLGHASNPNATWFTVANTILAGIWLAQAYLKTRALWYPIGLHFSWNFIMAYVYSLPVSGIVLSSQLLTAKDHGPQWLTGGDYGPEGSILCTGVLVVAIVWQARTGFLKWRRRWPPSWSRARRRRRRRMEAGRFVHRAQFRSALTVLFRRRLAAATKTSKVPSNLPTTTVWPSSASWPSSTPLLASPCPPARK